MRITVFNHYSQNRRNQSSQEYSRQPPRPQPPSIANFSHHQLLSTKKTIRSTNITFIDLLKRRQKIALPNISCINLLQPPLSFSQQHSNNFVLLQQKSHKKSKSERSQGQNRPYVGENSKAINRAVKSLAKIENMNHYKCQIRLSEILGSSERGRPTLKMTKGIGPNNTIDSPKKKEYLNDHEQISFNRKQNRSFLNNFLKTRYQTNRGSLRQQISSTSKQKQESHLHEEKIFSPWEKAEEGLEDFWPSSLEGQ